MLEQHARRGDFSRWVGDVFADRPLAARLAEIEKQDRDGRLPDLRTALSQVVADRYILAGADD